MTGGQDPGTGAAGDLPRVVASLAARLPDQVEGMLDDPRFEAGRAALDRLRDPAHAETLNLLDPREAAWLADELRRRWAAVGDVVLEPVAWIEEHARGAGTDGGDTTARLLIRVDGLEPGWTVAWTGATPDPTDPTIAAPSGAGAVTARAMGRGPSGRVILAASWDPGT